MNIKKIYQRHHTIIHKQSIISKISLFNPLFWKQTISVWGENRQQICFRSGAVHYPQMAPALYLCRLLDQREI